MPGDHTTVRVDRYTRCDFCGGEAHYDAKTKLGPWAYMCDAHYAAHGVGLGLGVGQKMVLK